MKLGLDIIAGDIQTVDLDPDELAVAVPWLTEQADALPDGVLRDALLGIAYGLGRCLPPSPELAPEPGPLTINTLEG